MLSKMNLGIIGTGNMGSAIIGGLIRKELVNPQNIFAYDIEVGRMDDFCKTFKVRKCANSREVVTRSSLVLLAVKPQNMRDVLYEIKPAVSTENWFLSIAAGITTSFMEETLGNKPRVVRAMPNTPGLIGAGATAIAPGKYAGDDEVSTALKIFTSIGIAIKVIESNLDAVTALSGSGPAYFFYLIECLTDAAEAVGLNRDIASHLARQTALGAAKLALDSTDTPAELRKKVTSRGGTTEAALDVLFENHFADIIQEAIQAATQRAAELSKKV